MKDIIEKALDVAVREALPLRIVYDGKDGITERTILPKRVDAGTVTAYCRLRRRISTFKTDRILSAQVVYPK